MNAALNPRMVALVDRGWGPSCYAIVETVGRRSGQPRRTPVANGLDGDTFWLLAGLGEQADYARNLKADPCVRVKAPPPRLRDGRRACWRTGTATPLPDDDAEARQRELARGRPRYRLDGVALRALSHGPMLTVRIDLD
jgi:deazaflavin-dependent oxidoreductase (nitroreductase family)